MEIDVTFDQSQSSLPAGFVSAIDYVVDYYDSVFTNAVTVNIDVGYGEIDGQALESGAIGESQSNNVDQFTYLTLASALKADEPSANQQSAYATLPTGSPLHGGTLWVTSAEQKALGLLPANDTAIDGYVGFSSTDSFSYSVTATPGSNQYYFIGIAEHEISEVMGRVSYIGEDIGGTNSFSIMDLFRWAGAGTRQLAARGPAYFSIDNGDTDLDNWNTDPSGDLGDWDSSAGNDSYLAFTSAGTIDPVTPVDLELMNVIGWDLMGPVSSGTVYVASGQISNGLVVEDAGAVVVLSGGTAIATVASASGAQYVDAGGSASGTLLSTGGDEFVEAGGVASGTVADGGSQVVYGTAAATMVVAGSYLYLESGTTLGAVVSSGVEVVYGTASDTTDDPGGDDFVFSGGIAIGTILSGGEEYVESGALANGTVLDGSAQIVYGSATGTTVNDGGYEYLEPGGSTDAVTVNNGIDVIYGTALATTVAGAGADYVEPGGTASGTRLDGGVEFVEIGTVAIATVAVGGAQVVYGTADGTVLNGGAYEYLEPGGSANATLVTSGIDVIYGAASATTVAGAGDDFVEPAGSADATVLSGGVEYVEAAGNALDTVVSAGAQVVYGTASATTLDPGAFQYVSAGGVASASVIAGGYEYVLAGGAVSAATIGGGTLELTSGAVDGGAPIGFAAGGEAATLRLDDSQALSGTVAGFTLSDQLDLSDIGFGIGTTLGFQEAGTGTSGTLTVTDGTHTANLTLLGQYAAGQFYIASDGHGGTIVTDLPSLAADLAAPLLGISRQASGA